MKYFQELKVSFNVEISEKVTSKHHGDKTGKKGN